MINQTEVLLMECKTALESIKYARHNSTIVINTTNTIIKLNEADIDMIDKEDAKTIYLHDNRAKRDYYVYTPSIEAIKILE